MLLANTIYYYYGMKRCILANKKQITFVVNFYHPVPAVKGGSLHTLLTELLLLNEKYKDFDATIYSIEDSEAQLASQSYHESKFIYVPKKQNIFRKYLYEILNRINRNNYRNCNLSAAIADMRQYPERVREIIIAEGCPLYLKALRDNFPDKYIIAHLHDGDVHPQSKYYKLLINNCNEIWTVSHYITNLVQGKFGDCPIKVHTLHNGVSERFFAKREQDSTLRERLNISQDDKVILYAGRVIPIKGVIELIKAYEQLNVTDVVLLILGKSSNTYGKKARKYCNKIKKRVIWGNFIPNSEIPNYYNLADVCVVPSMFQEPFGMTCLEAMASAKALIASNVGGIPEVTNNQGAILVEQDNNFVPNLSKALKEILADNGKIKQIGQAGQRQALEMTTEKMYNRFLSLCHIENVWGNRLLPLRFKKLEFFEQHLIPCKEKSSPKVLSIAPVISVIMLAYNHEKYIHEAIDSILSQQTDFPFEIIIGEDKSNDTTWEILLEYQSLYPDKIRLIFSDKNVGIAMNVARVLEKCRGKYIAICEGDDYWQRRDKLQIQFNYMEANPAYSAVYSNYNIYLEQNKFLRENIFNQNVLTKQTLELCDMLEYQNIAEYRYQCRTCTILFRAEAIRYANANLLYGKFNLSDLIIWWELLQAGKIMILSESLSTYRMNLPNLSATTKTNNKERLDFFLDVILINRYYMDKHFPAKTKDFLVYQIKQMIPEVVMCKDAIYKGKFLSLLDFFQAKLTFKERVYIFCWRYYFVGFLLLKTIKIKRKLRVVSREKEGGFVIN